MSTQTLTGAKNRLMSEYKDLAKEKWVHIELDDAAIFKWEVGLMVINTDSVFNGGYFKVRSLCYLLSLVSANPQHRL